MCFYKEYCSFIADKIVDNDLVSVFYTRYGCRGFTLSARPSIDRIFSATYPIWCVMDSLKILQTLRWRHNDHDSVSNHQPHGCLLNRLFRRRSKKTPKLRVTGLCVGNSPGPVNSPHKWPVTRKMFPFDDVIMIWSGMGSWVMHHVFQ